MTLLRGTTSVQGVMYHHTGTFIRFAAGLSGQLPVGDHSVKMLMPDGKVVDASFKSTAAFPYFAGPHLVHWIKKWLPWGDGEEVVIREPASGPLVTEFANPHPTASPALSSPKLHRSIKRLGLTRRRTRQAFQRWERDPALREAVLSVWGSECQVDGCDLASRGAGSLAPRMVDVHHVRSVSGGGTDSALNLCVLCVMHHVLVHRAPTSAIAAMDAKGVLVRVDGVTLNIKRDAIELMRGFRL